MQLHAELDGDADAAAEDAAAENTEIETAAVRKVVRKHKLVKKEYTACNKSSELRSEHYLNPQRSPTLL
jgi:hypothetical protein